MNVYELALTAGDENVARLLDQAYDPPAVPSEFADRVRQRLLDVAAERRTSVASTLPYRAPKTTRRFARVAAAAALLASIAAGFQFLSPKSETAGSRVAPEPDERRLPGPRPRGVVADVVNPGTELATKPGERRRVVLRDGSVLFLNADTVVRYDADRRITLKQGEVFVEVAPRSADKVGATFVVQTPNRAVTALGTKFVVKADGRGTNVAVTQGKVKVSDFDGVLSAGQQLLAGTSEAAPAPRASFLLDWARELMTSADGVLVPAARFQGGALLVVDSTGQEATLTLRRYHVDVHIEDGYARTTIDQTYFNYLASRQEGTFYFPLPPDASLSRLAMYVGGNLMEGGMVERNEGRAIFETIVRRQKDPALLEWVDGNTFKMRVFPLEGRQEKRIVLSYTQKLTGLYGKTQYRFPGGHSLEEVGRWSFHTRVKDGAAFAWQCDTHSLSAKKDDGDLVLDAEAEQVKLGRDVVLGLTDVHTGLTAVDHAQLAQSRLDNARYFQVRLRPDLRPSPQPASHGGEGRVRGRRDWLFIVEASAERDSLLARTQIEIVRNLLDQAEHDDRFLIVAASARPQIMDRELRPVTAENVSAAVGFLEGINLIGALDLERALEEAAPLVKDAQDLHVVHVGSGLTVVGERRPEVLVRRLPAESHYVGVAVGKKWNRTLMKLAAEKSGGFFTQINPDDAVAWRAFELYSTLNTPRLLGVTVTAEYAARKGSTEDSPKLTFLCHSTAVAQGEELCAIARCDGIDGPLPEKLIVVGTLDGKPYRREIKIEKVKAGADYLPRTWGRLEVERLVAAGAAENKAALIALSKSLYVMTPFTSLLVLENEAMYAQYHVDRGRKDHWALYACPDRIPVVYEPLPGMAGIPAVPAPQAQTAKPSAEQILKTVASRPPLTLLAYPAAPIAVDPKNGGGAPVQQFGTTGYAPANPYYQFNPYGLYMPNGYGGFGIPNGSYNGAYPYQVNPYLNLQTGYGGLGMPGLTTAMSANPSQVSPYWNLNRGGSSAPGVNYYSLVVPYGSGRTASVLTESSGRVYDNRPSLDFSFPIQGRGPVDETTARHRFLTQLDTPDRRLGWPGKDSFPDPNRSNEYSMIVKAHQVETAQSIADKARLKRDLQLAGLATISDRLLDDEAKFRDRIGFDVKWTEKQPEAAWPRQLEDVERKRFVQKDLPAAPLSESWSLLYQRPQFSNDPRVFRDLVAYAPGLQANESDLRAVLEAEGGEVVPPAGKIDPAAKALIDRARSLPWQAVTVPDADVTVVCNGAGCYRYERVLSTGLRELVLCNGTTLFYVYAELGLAGKRVVSRHHRSELSQLVPWALPPVENLTRSADLILVDEHTVAVTASGRPCVQLVFAEDGRLSERQLADKPGGKVLARESYGADGSVRRTVEGKERLVGTWAVKPAAAPDLKPDMKELVILPVPARTAEHVLQSHKLPPLANMAPADYQNLDANVALELVAAEACAGNNSLLNLIVSYRFLNEGDRRAGFYVLLFAPQHHVGLSALPQPKRALTPIERYMRRVETSNVTLPGPRLEGFAGQMATFHALVTAWTQNNVSPNHLKRAPRFVKECRSPVQAWAVVATILQDMSGTTPVSLKRDLLEAVLVRVKGIPVLEYAARYEHAVCLMNGDGAAKGRAEFLRLYEETYKQGALPPVDVSARLALRGGDRSGAQAKAVAADFAAKGLGLAVVTLARQCVLVGEPALADELVDALLLLRDRGADRSELALGLLEFRFARGQWEEADRLLAELLDDPKLADRPALWRRAYAVSTNRNQPGRAVERLERALDLEYTQDFGVLNLDEIRQDYQALLTYYARQADALRLLDQKAPTGFIAKVVRAASRWRALDPAGMAAACPLVGTVLRQVGEPDLAWDYQTTPLAQATTESAQWYQIATEMAGADQTVPADRAYASAFALDPTNARILWDRANNLAKRGAMTAKARDLYGEIVEGTWDAKYQPLKDQAKAILER